MDELTLRATLRNELSGPLEQIRREVRGAGRDAEQSGRAADRASSGWRRLGAGAASFVRTNVASAAETARRSIERVGLAVSAVGSAVGVIGLKTAAQMETAEIAFTTMLGSGRKARAFLKELAQFAAVTPFDFVSLQTAASQLVAIGVDAKDVIPIMTTLGNVTSGMGTGAEGVKRATYAIQQMIAAQRISAQDLWQLRDAGIPVYELLSQALGKSTAQIAALVDDGKLGADALNAMMTALRTGQGLERFNGLMEKQSQSLSGLWSTFKDTANIRLATAIKPIIPTLKSGLDALTGWVTVTADLTNQLLRGTGPMKSTHRWLVKIGDAAGTVVGWMRDHKDAVIGFAVALGAISGALGLAALVASINPLTVAVVAVSALVGWLVHLYRTNDEARAKMDRIWDATKRFAGVVRRELTPAAQDAKRELGDLWENVLKPAGIWLGDHMPAAIDKTSDHFVLCVKWVRLVSHAVAWLWRNALEPLTVFMLTQAIPASAMLGSAFLGMARVSIQGFHSLLLVAFDVFDRMLAGAEKAFGWMPEIGDKIAGARREFDTLNTVVDGSLTAVENGLADTDRALRTAAGTSKTLGEKLDELGRKNVRPTVTVDYKVAQGPLGVLLQGAGVGISGSPSADSGLGLPIRRGGGDTGSRHGRGGSFANTLWQHQRASLLSGTRLRVTNTHVGGGGRGYGSGDHQAGRAVDMQGPGMATYAATMRAMGGFAEFHGDGADRHLHVVPPASGDTGSPRALASGGAPGVMVVVQDGGIRVQVVDAADDVDVEKAVAAGVARYFRDRGEREAKGGY